MKLGYTDKIASKFFSVWNDLKIQCKDYPNALVVIWNIAYHSVSPLPFQKGDPKFWKFQ